MLVFRKPLNLNPERSQHPYTPGVHKLIMFILVMSFILLVTSYLQGRARGWEALSWRDTGRVDHADVALC